jgi:hypothetical protein
MEDVTVTRNVLHVRRPEALPSLGTWDTEAEVASPSGAVVESCVHACVLKHERNEFDLSP